ncbi:MAG: site-2 protease family protein [Elusimicrobia bacterium]|nr:site-2 protease family protein [Elusimicrobiota bacterium]
MIHYLIHHLQSALAVILTFGVVIFLHESGHFFVCRWLGVKVERFAFGFGPELLGITSNGTRFSVCAFPLGGFVKPAGEELESCSGKPDEYFAQSWNRRLAIVAAGPAMNYALAFVLFTGVIFVNGVPEPGRQAVIGNMMIGFPADRAGLKVDDVVTAVGGQPVSSWEELAGAIHKYPNQEIELRYRRGGQEGLLKVVPRKDEASGQGLIGITPKPVYRPVGFFEAGRQGARQCWVLTLFTVKTIASKIMRRERPDLAGPVGIVQMVSQAAHSSLEDLISLIGLISVAIGFFNILPVPLLDGGHGAMYLWEGLSGRKLTRDAMNLANSVGIAFLVSLLLFATYNDFLRIRGERSVGRPPASQAR